jgi:TetR/AcrR family transcriptional repressor of nem operon
MYIRHDKEKVLESGMRLFWYKGYSSLGINEICKETGMTKGAFYNAFKSKENFLLYCLAAYDIMNVNFLNTQLNNTKEKAINRISNFYTGMFNAEPTNNFSGCMINNIMSEIGSHNELISEVTDKLFRNILQAILPIIHEAQYEGDITSLIDAPSIAELLHTSFYGALTRSKSTKNPQIGIDTMTLLIKSLKTI